MLRTLGVVIGGMFVGAVAVEVLRKKYPDGTEKLYSKVNEFGSGIKQGLKDGFHRATKSSAVEGA